MSIPEIYLVFLLFSFLLFTCIRIFPLCFKVLKPGKIGLNEISVVIPFRNEENNLPDLLSSILLQQQLPNEILFVNDNSDDESEELVKAFIKQNRLGKLLSLQSNRTGKKEALNYGISTAKSRFILTLDADVILSKSHFNYLSSLSNKSMSSLPVIMKSNGFIGRLFSTEYSFFNAFNFLISPIWPISVSGANLLFDSKMINYNAQLDEHQHLASGDDYFLLKHFRKRSLPIYINNENHLSVETAAPSSFKSYFDQRVRWLSKGRFQVDWFDSVIGLFVFLYFIGGLVSLIIAVINWQWFVFGSVIILRFLIDTLVYLNYAQKLKETRNILVLPFFQIIYPLLFFGVMMLTLFYKPKWKGRDI